MDLLSTVTGRKVLFGLLYFSEGAPIGFIWLGLPTRLRSLDVPLEQITWLMAFLILPWTLKFLWAPLIDLLRGPRWGFKHWITASQSAMALTLMPLLFLDLQQQFTAVSACLLAHAVAAATQDISVDALCIQQSTPQERGALNGWMQGGVLVGRAAMGGGSLMLQRWIGFGGVVCVLILLVLVSILLLIGCRERKFQLSGNGLKQELPAPWLARFAAMWRALLADLRGGQIWLGLFVAVSVPAAFKSLEAVIGPFLIDRDYPEYAIGQFTSTAMIGGMITGSLLAGRLSHRINSGRFLAIAIMINVLAITSFAVSDLTFAGDSGNHLLVLLSIVAVTIGWMTVALYNWLMNLTDPQLAATQFTAFMAATNACEAWSTALIGRLQSVFGYPPAVLVLSGISLGSALVAFALARRIAGNASEWN
ncbi:muropeptide transporter [Stieleria maiorica]|uniref:Muropeptide transporter n=1 Tax=Stieleria maiorica TaxID=2795974 RepID=A0A5B9MD16_9BACT|nr:MFS transporter [Stieleria maiorica]QEF98958.1 muropeptide transporter [Stieleria maiorica]